MSLNHYYVYVLNCSNGSYYTGYTNNLARRYQEHLAGTAKCKYTRSFKPLGIASCWRIYGAKAMAMKVERYIKQLSRAEKQDLLASPKQLLKLFHCKVITTNDVSWT